MPPHSKSLIEEGASFKSFHLVKKGVFNEAELVEALITPGNSSTYHVGIHETTLNSQKPSCH
jgi:N-methylhydantoinase B/oxoprolinase/acetone carboxylase alpha subunit